MKTSTGTLRIQLVTQQVIGREVGQRLNISKEDEQADDEAHESNDFAQPEEIRLSEILISTDKKPNDTRNQNQIIEDAQAKANSGP